MFACPAALQGGRAGARDGVGEPADLVHLVRFEVGGLALQGRDVLAHGTRGCAARKRKPLTVLSARPACSRAAVAALAPASSCPRRRWL